MTPYPKYKPSGIEWIGEIPDSWSVKRLKRFARILNGQDQKGVIADNGIYPIYGTGGEFGRSNTYLHKGPSVILGRKGTIDKPRFVDSPFWSVDTAYYTDILPTTCPRFFYYCCLTINFELYKYGSAVPSMSQEVLSQIPFCSPSLNEQQAIAAYLDDKTNAIDIAIAKKQKLIEFLKEEKAAIINKAVTKGIDKKVKLKPSGIDWLGDVPEHWEVSRIKYVCVVQGRIGFKGYKSSDLVPEGDGALVLGATHITRQHKIDITEPVFLSWEKYHESPEIMVEQGQIVFTQRGAYLGKVALIDRDYGKVTINPSLILLKEIQINCGYLTFYLTSHYVKKSIELISSNTAIPMIGQETLSNFYCLVPPINEQEEIFAFVNQKIEAMDHVINRIEKEIELLQEYRTALISEVVTGKVRVA